MKKEFVWLKEVDSIAIQSSVRNLADAYTRFLKTKQCPTLQI
jgi:putative transposase